MPSIGINVPAGGAAITEARAGGRSLTLYSDAGLTTAVTLPYALSASAPVTVYVGPVGAFDIVVRATASGRLLGTASGTSLAATDLVFTPATGAGVSPGVLAADPAFSGTYAPIGWRRRSLPSPAAWLPPTTSDVPTIAASGPGGASPITGTGAWVYDYLTAPVTHLGVVDTVVNSFGANYLQNQAVGVRSGYRAATFDYDGADLDLVVFPRVGVNQSWVWVWVDGAPCTSAPVPSLITWSGGSGYLRLTFSTAKWRRLVIYYSGCDFGGLNVPVNNTTARVPKFSVVAAPRPGRRIAVIGDSYTADTGCLPFVGWAWILGRMLGAEVFNLGIGGTGYTAPGSATVFGSTARINPLATINPDALFWLGSINDGSASAVAVGNAASAAYALAKTKIRNDCLQVVAGVQTIGTSQTAANTANSAAVVSAAQSAGAIVALDPSASGWVTGTGRAPLPAPRLALLTTAGTGGTFTAGTYYYVVTSTNALGETTRSNEISATVANNGTITVNWWSNSMATGYKVYRGTTPGGENALIYTGTALSVTDTGSAGSAASPPGTNTTGSAVGDGTADILMGGDGIHPSGDMTTGGHLMAARRVYDAFAAAIPA